MTPTSPQPNPDGSDVRSAVQQQANDPPPDAVQSCPQDKTWVGFRLVDMEGNPVGGKQYRAKLSDGSIKQGTLDDSGRVRFDGIPPGTCTISFIDLDKEAWERI
jgi:hypothetical protein